MLENLIGNKARSLGLSTVMRAAGLVTRCLPIPQPTLLVGPGASARLGKLISSLGHKKILIVTDPVVAKLGLLTGLTQSFTEGACAFVVFDEISADAPLPQIDKGIYLYKTTGCDAIVAVGGGSVMDAAKAIGLSVANHKSPRQLVGYFRGLWAPPPLYAVPTTAGTGSEVTVAAVISDPVNNKKLLIADTRLVPKMAALDPCLMTGLPPNITATTGLDALTHAIEAFIGHWSTADSDQMALAAVTLIYENLRTVYTNGTNLLAREQMSLASTYAGMAFTRANVGYVHAIAHQFGATYHTPHGLANALVLPHVLRFYGTTIEDKLALLALRAKVGSEGDAVNVLATKFLDSIDVLIRDLGIPCQLDALRKTDISALAKAACQEADANYPVPLYMTVEQCENLIRLVLPKPAPRKKMTAKKQL